MEPLDDIVKVLEFIDPKLQIKQSNYTLKAIVVKKLNMFGIITSGIPGLVYYKTTCCENLRTWPEALFSAYEGDFLPSLLVFVRNDKEEQGSTSNEFVSDLTMASFKNMQQMRKQCIRSTHRYEKVERETKDLKLNDMDLAPTKENALRVLNGLNDRYNS